ncbi:hypothetical protein E2F47_06145 [Mycobacterium eburneum]|nr:hypothetical protein [Mycobacterium eburneum]TDH56708.1 hypothetical protein E2F47_06145 [Mycobacterium eburneum]
MKIATRILEAFNRWFASTAGVWQTFLFTVGVLVWEFCDPTADPHGFWLLFALTVYSGITQPILAHVAAKAARNTDRMLTDDCVVDRKTYELLLRIAKKLEVDQ